jgi:hypothetical protein
MDPSADTTHLTVEVEDAGHTSLLGSLVTTLSGQQGTQVSRFVARTTDTREPATVVAISATFPVGPLALIDGQGAAPDGGWPDEARSALEELDAQLLADGWHSTATGPRWWDRSYARRHRPA